MLGFVTDIQTRVALAESLDPLHQVLDLEHLLLRQVGKLRRLALVG
ncbi:hypothetical protein [Notoacmeibacter marinus]|nr:hypothetical protein [Notoacmeibacter marinus]